MNTRNSLADLYRPDVPRVRRRQMFVAEITRDVLLTMVSQMTPRELITTEDSRMDRLAARAAYLGGAMYDALSQFNKEDGDQ